MQNKNVLVLGATSDIAVALVKQLAKSTGYNFWLAGRNINRLTPLKTDIEIVNKNAQVLLFELDAVKYETHNDFWKQLPGTPQWVVLSFGYYTQQEEAEKNQQMALDVININFTGAVSLLNTAANLLESQQSGVILGISSVAGDRGRAKNYLYGSAKAGLSAYLDGMRNRLYKANVRVITYKPGFVYTKMTANMPLPQKLTAQPNHIANSMINALNNKNGIVYAPKFWWLIMLIIRNIPDVVFRRLKI